MAWLGFNTEDRALRDAALHDAQELRSRYGTEAEELCEIGIMAASSPRQRRLLKSIRRALSQLPS